MKIRMLDSLGTMNGSYTKGTEYDLPDAEARNLIEVGLAIDPAGKVTPFKKANRQTMDAKTGVAAENISPPTASLTATGDAGENQTAASVEAAATAAKVIHTEGAPGPVVSVPNTSEPIVPATTNPAPTPNAHAPTIVVPPNVTLPKVR